MKIYRWHYECKLYIQILNKKMTAILKKLGRRGIFQHDNDPKHTAKIPKAFLEKKRENYDLAKYVPDTFGVF